MSKTPSTPDDESGITLDLTTLAARVVSKLQAVAKHLEEIAALVISGLNQDPEFRLMLMDRGLNELLIDRLERYGRGQIHKSLVICSDKVAEKLIELPLSEQSLALRDGVDVADPMGLSAQRKIPVFELTKAQISQVFDGGHIRSIEQQRSYIHNKRAIRLKVIDGSIGLQKTARGVSIKSMGILITNEMIRTMFEMISGEDPENRSMITPEEVKRPGAPSTASDGTEAEGQ